MIDSGKRLGLHISLFLLTLISTTLSGAEWLYGRLFIPFENMPTLGWAEFKDGFQFSIPFLTILTVHEFGHYAVAQANRVRVTLPYYIPFWLGIMQTIGTLGAFIRIEESVNSRRKYFDIGIAGPLAGLLPALLVLWYGFSHLPPADYIFSIHPEYKKWGMAYGQFAYQNLPEGSAFGLGNNLIFWFFKTYIADPARLPHPNEMVHYPYLFAGYLGLFFTSLNLIPIGQLDGGHILYGLLGRRRYETISRVLFIAFTFYAGLGIYRPSDFMVVSDQNYWTTVGWFVLYVVFLSIAFSRISPSRQTVWVITLGVVLAQLLCSWLWPTLEGYSGFLVFAFLLGRILGIYHPETPINEPLDGGRKLLGWLALLAFALCFSPQPFLIN